MIAFCYVLRRRALLEQDIKFSHSEHCSIFVLAVGFSTAGSWAGLEPETGPGLSRLTHAAQLPPGVADLGSIS